MTADPWGITQLKPTGGTNEEFFMNNDDFDGSSRVYSSESFSSSGGWTSANSSSFRVSMSTSTGFDDGACTQNQQTMVNQGYMQSSNDWKNVEFTVELEVTDSASDHMTVGFRGARHTGSGGPRGCTGCNYKVSVEMDGNGVKLDKESWHVSYHGMGDWSVSGLNVQNPFRLKALCYNTNNNTNVTVECHIAVNADNNFQQVFTATDSGQVNNDAGECECNDDSQPLVWGSPTILLRGDEGGYRFRNMSIREIDPTGTGGGSGGGGETTWSHTNLYSSGDDGNVVSNTRDGDLSTRWSAHGDGQWMTVDLGQSREIDQVGISWYQGASRTSDFDIQTSDNNSSWTTRFTGTSSGTTEQIEKYDLSPNPTARYVRIVGHGNSSNDWNSVNEVVVYGPPDTGGGGSGGGETQPTTGSSTFWNHVYVIDYEELGLCNPAGG